MTARSLTLRGIPDVTLARLRARAEANHRSLNGELLAILEQAAHGAATASEAADVVLARVDSAELARVCRRHHIVWLAVFGSHARGAADATSDVDVVVDFAPGMTPGLGIERVAAALRPLFGGRRIDLVTRRGLSPRLRERVLTSPVTLYAAE